MLKDHAEARRSIAWERYKKTRRKKGNIGSYQYFDYKCSFRPLKELLEIRGFYPFRGTWRGQGLPLWRPTMEYRDKRTDLVNP